VAATRPERKIISTRSYIAAACIGALFTGTGVAAGSSSRQADAREIYSAFTMLARKAPTTHRCGVYTVTKATYTAQSTSPDPRLAGAVTFVAKLVLNGEGTGLATGRLTIRDRRKRIRMRGTLRGVVSRRSDVSGILSGSLRRPNALLLANVSMFLYPGFRQAVVRVGLYDSKNSAVAYSLGKCGGA
jgi:hypothetical protein